MSVSRVELLHANGGENRNLTDKLLSVHGDKFTRFVQAQYSQFGFPNSTRDVAVVHEVGHIVTGLAMGGTFKSSTVFLDVQVNGTPLWGGFTEITVPGVNDKGGTMEAFKPVEQPIFAMKNALHMVAGIAGEMRRGLYHPSSSLDEMFNVQATAVSIAPLYKRSGEEMFSFFIAAALGLLDANAALFDALVSCFTIKNFVTAKESQATVQRLGVVHVGEPPPPKRR